MFKHLQALLLAFTFAAFAPLVQAMDGLMIHEPWSRPLPPTARNGAAYLMIHNHGDEADRLLGGATDIAERVEIHTHIMQNDLMKMVRVEGAEIPPGEMVNFKPHGLHVMLMGLKEPLVDGAQYQLTLEFERAGSQEITVTIEDRGMGEMKHGDHGNHGGSGS